MYHTDVVLEKGLGNWKVVRATPDQVKRNEKYTTGLPIGTLKLIIHSGRAGSAGGKRRLESQEWVASSIATLTLSAASDRGQGMSMSLLRFESARTHQLPSSRGKRCSRLIKGP